MKWKVRRFAEEEQYFSFSTIDVDGRSTLLKVIGMDDVG
jgi:hypothetical protein